MTPRRASGIAALSLLGWTDDVIGHVPVGLRLAGQLTAGALSFGTTLHDAPVAAATTACAVNVFNFMDGINGISALTALVWGLNTALLEEAPKASVTIGAVTAGAALGFLPYNLPRARLFLGDVGSYAFGSAIAAGILRQDNPRVRILIASPLIPYVTDVARGLVRKGLKGEPIGAPHRNHFYQQLVDEHGLSHTKVAFLYAAASLVSAAGTRLVFNSLKRSP